jgi:plasmid replication initiation protein
MYENLLHVGEKWIYQSNKFIESSFYLTINEQKMIRLVASMVKKNDTEFKEYNFKVSDIGLLFGNKKNIYKNLESTADLLMTRFIKIKTGDKPKDWKSYHIIKNAACKDGIFTIQIDEQMKDFYLELNEYTKYQLKNILQFNSTYSFRVYELLKQYVKLKNRVIDIGHLREILDIGKQQYKLYGHFKSRVLLPSKDEINEYTDISFDFDEVKDGKKVVAIKFAINSKLNDEILLPQTEEFNKIDNTIQKLADKFKDLYHTEISVLEIDILVKQYGQNKVSNCIEYLHNSLPNNYTNDMIINYFRNAVIKNWDLNPKTSKCKIYQHDFDQRYYSDEQYDSFISNKKES